MFPNFFKNWLGGWVGGVNLSDFFQLDKTPKAVGYSVTPQPLRLWGIVITRGGWSGGRAVRNSALTKKVN